jgi:hypothetical protein
MKLCSGKRSGNLRLGEHKKRKNEPTCPPGGSGSTQYKVTVQPLGGDSTDVSIETPTITVQTLRMLITREIGVATYRQELYEVAVPEDGKSAVREDDAEPRLLKLTEMIAAGTTVALLVNEAVKWDSEWKGDSIVLSEDGTIAKNSNLEEIFCGECVRGEKSLEPNSGIHRFEYIYTNGQDGAAMGGCYFVGVAKACMPKASGNDSIAHSIFSNIWAIEDGGEVSEACLTERYTERFYSGDKIGLTIDMGKGTINFVRNGTPMVEVQEHENHGCFEGSRTERTPLVLSVPVDGPLHLIACVFNAGSAVHLAVPTQ